MYLSLPCFYAFWYNAALVPRWMAAHIRLIHPKGAYDMFRKIFDGHIHIFSPKIIENVRNRKALSETLHLEIREAPKRIFPSALTHSMHQSGVVGGLLLPTAAYGKVAQTNHTFLELAGKFPSMLTAATLHPYEKNIKEQLQRLMLIGVRAIKLCSFSQGFDLTEPKAEEIFETIAHHNRSSSHRFFIILDTFCNASRYFSTSPDHDTTVEKLAYVTASFPSINFVAAHMGGLNAVFDQIRTRLTPRANLYLDTSNAAHTLEPEQFVYLLKQHGPAHIIFGTDWPWFGHEQEIHTIETLARLAAYKQPDLDRLFYLNIVSLLDL